jgi:hypothetical protein
MQNPRASNKTLKVCYMDKSQHAQHHTTKGVHVCQVISINVD